MKQRKFTPGISFTVQAVAYPIFLVGAFIFAQLLKQPISYMLLWAVMLLPVISAVQLIAAGVGMRVGFRAPQKTVTKSTPMRISAVVANKSPVPMPFVEAVILFPEDGGARCCSHRFAFPVMAFGTAHIEKSCEFAFIGEYSVGVTELYIYDFFRAVRLRIPMDKTCTISVLPRIYELPPKESLASSNDKESKGRTGDLDIIGIREYRYGDNPRHIHWKLTSKSEDTVVKEYIGGEGSPGYILCDLHPPFPCDGTDMPPHEIDIANRACLDLIIESALSAAKRELDLSGSAVIALTDHGEPFFERITAQAELELAAVRLCSVCYDNTEEQLSALAEQLALPQNASVIGVGAVLNAARTSEFLAVVDGIGDDAGRHEFIFCRDAVICPIEGSESGIINGCRARLTSNGVTVIAASDHIAKRREIKCK